ncbi:MAG: M81 family metallopeptidase [Alphaproteobacteria bacterium]|nr:M81 family metallopeptidase [Alphaproteobacteria bacterium]
MTGPRVALLGLHLEANAFAPPTERGDFEALCALDGAEILDEARKPNPAMPMEMVGFIREMTAAGPWTPVPIRLWAAEPGGPVMHEDLEAWLTEVVKRIRQAGLIDAVYISAHGALTTTHHPDGDGMVWSTVRGFVGSRTPMVATVDLHANLSDIAIGAIDAVIGYRTNPHVDQRERGADAARLIRSLLQKVELHMLTARIPLVAPTVTLLTEHGPFADLVRAGQEVQRQQRSIANVTILPGFAFSDTPHNGLRVCVTGHSPETARMAVRQLCRMAWETREKFQAHLTSLETTVSYAKQAMEGRRPPVLIADVADNPGGGARGNTVWVLQALIQGGVTGAVLGLHIDPKLAEECQQRTLGKRFLATLNRQGNSGFTRRFQTEAKLLAHFDGKLTGSSPGIFAGRSIDLGPCAALEIDGNIVVVASHRKQCADPAFLTSLGIDLKAARVVVVKSRGHFRAGFSPYFTAEQIIEVDAPGLTSPMLSRFDFVRLPRPVFPLDTEANWTAPM